MLYIYIYISRTLCACLYFFIVDILFAPVVSTSIHHCVNKSHIKVLMKVIETKTFNTDFISQWIHLLGLFYFSAFFIKSDLDSYLLSYMYTYIYIYIYMGRNIKISMICKVGWFLWHINLCRLFNAKSIFIQIISSISNNSV